MTQALPSPHLPSLVGPGSPSEGSWVTHPSVSALLKLAIRNSEISWLCNFGQVTPPI